MSRDVISSCIISSSIYSHHYLENNYIIQAKNASYWKQKGGSKNRLFYMAALSFWFVSRKPLITVTTSCCTINECAAAIWAFFDFFCVQLLTTKSAQFSILEDPFTTSRALDFAFSVRDSLYRIQQENNKKQQWDQKNNNRPQEG